MEDRYLVISDVDGTLLGDDDAVGRFAAWVEPRRDLLRLVYNSGRLCGSVRDSIESTDLPVPDAIIGGVGTEIQPFDNDEAVGDWPACCLNGAWQPLRVCSILAEYSEAELQPAKFLSDFKLSYYARDVSSEWLGDLHARLSAAGLHVQLVYSSNRDLDVLPAGVDKGAAAEFLARHWSVSRSRVVVCGDSGNDLAMFERGFCGVVVANAHEELTSLDSSQVFHAGQPFADGVLEGLCHWCALPEPTRPSPSGRDA